MATYVVGDVQGCFDELKSLLKKVNFNQSDTLWFAGDLVNRGEKNVETLRFAKKLGNRARVVLGNHDLHLLACWHGERQMRRKDTFYDVLAAKDCDKLLNWLQKQPLMYSSKKYDYLMVHAGIPPMWTPKEAQVRANEVSRALQSKKAATFFANMYGDSPLRWHKGLAGMKRLRVITNYLTRMRFCKKNGTLDLDSKTAPDMPPSGFAPWYSFTHHKCAHKKVVFGHWAALMGATGVDHFIALDTGCVWGGKLTALRLEDSKRFCVHCPSALL